MKQSILLLLLISFITIGFSRPIEKADSLIQITHAYPMSSTITFGVELGF